MAEITDDIWKCLKCGVCCEVFGENGITVTENEWESIEEDICQLGLNTRRIKEAKKGLFIPTKGKYGVKSCVFLNEKKTVLYI